MKLKWRLRPSRWREIQERESPNLKPLLGAAVAERAHAEQSGDEELEGRAEAEGVGAPGGRMALAKGSWGWVWRLAQKRTREKEAAELRAERQKAERLSAQLKKVEEEKRNLATRVRGAERPGRAIGAK